LQAGAELLSMLRRLGPLHLEDVPDGGCRGVENRERPPQLTRLAEAERRRQPLRHDVLANAVEVIEDVDVLELPERASEELLLVTGLVERKVVEAVVVVGDAVSGRGYRAAPRALANVPVREREHLGTALGHPWEPTRAMPRRSRIGSGA
jgi:hypothetical protein